MNWKIATVSGDGVGPEIISAAKRVLTACGDIFGLDFSFEEAPAGGIAIDNYGDPLPQSSLDLCNSAHAVLLGAVGGPKWVSCKKNPESALLGLRKALGLFANLRPIKLYPQLAEASTLKPCLLEKGIDFVIVRELTGGIYFGERGYRNGKYGREAYDTEVYGALEIERIARVAFELAEKRNRRVVSVDKANVLLSSYLWRTSVHDTASDYPSIELTDMLVDNAAMQIARNPSQFDVVLTTNMFGDILSDLASALVGSIGLLPSASVNDTTVGLYEPIHGSAPDIAGLGIVNPIGTILSTALMLRHSMELFKPAEAIEKSVEAVLSDGIRTKDVAFGGDYVSTEAMTDAIIAKLRRD